MAYNSSTYKQRSGVIAGLDCGFAVKGVPVEDNFPEARFTSTATTVVALGECVGMIRVAANTILLGAEFYWDDAAPAAIVAIGDPFACARILGPISVGTARGIFGTNPGSCGAYVGTCGSLTKMGVQGDGCGVGYRFTCETDIVMTNLYSDSLATVGGWAGGGAAASNPGSQSTAINAGTYHLILHVKKGTAVS